METRKEHYARCDVCQREGFTSEYNERALLAMLKFRFPDLYEKRLAMGEPED